MSDVLHAGDNDDWTECPRFRNEWETFEEHIPETEVYEQNKRLPDKYDVEDHVPKFGTDWEQFNDDSENLNELPAVRLKKESVGKDIDIRPPSKEENPFEEFERSKRRSASIQGIYHVNTQDDKFVCEISDICLLPDDGLLLTDQRNKTLRRLSKNYVLKSYLKLSDNPFGVCKIDNTQVAVTLVARKKVQFVSVRRNMTLKKSFYARECCWGITCHSGLLFICCGGSSSTDTEETDGQGHLGVYSQSGTYLSKYSKGLSSPRYVCINNDLTRILITDLFNSIIVLDMDGRMVSQIHHEECNYPSGICKFNDTLFCVAYHEKNEVWSVDETGHFKEVLLKREDGLVAPCAVFYDIDRARLVVSSMSADDTLKVFRLRPTTE